MHGSTALQLVNGMAGALIVQDPPGEGFEVNEDLLWIVQEVIGEKASNVYNCTRSSETFTVNGEENPSTFFDGVGTVSNGTG